MTVALVATRIPSVADLEIGVLSDEWIRCRFGPDDVVVFVDMASPAADRLLHDGYRVEIHPKRATADAGHERTGDQARAGIVAALAPERIVYSSDAALDLSWHEPGLIGIPTTVLVSGRTTAAIPVVLDDAVLWADHGVGAWLAASALSSSVLEADEDVAALGIRGLDAASTWPTPEPPGPGALVVVTMLAPPRASLVAAWRRFVDDVPVDESMSVVVVVRPRRKDSDDVRALLGAVFGERPGPPPLVVLADDAAPFLAQADTLVVGNEADLLVPAVARVARERGVRVLERVERGGRFAPPDAGTGRARRVGTGSGTAAEMAAGLRTLVDTDVDVAVLDLGPGTDADVERLLAHAGLGTRDLTLVASIDHALGSPRLDHVADDVVAAHRRLWPSILRWLDEGFSAQRVLRSLSSPGMGSHASVQVVPSVRSLPHAPAVPIWRLPVPLTDGPIPPPRRAIVPEDATVVGGRTRVLTEIRRLRVARTVLDRVPVDMKRRVRDAVDTARGQS